MPRKGLGKSKTKSGTTTTVRNGKASTTVRNVNATTTIRNGNANTIVRNGNVSPIVRNGNASPIVRNGNASPIVRNGNATTTIRNGNANTIVRNGNVTAIIRRGDAMRRPLPKKSPPDGRSTRRITSKQTPRAKANSKKGPSAKNSSATTFTKVSKEAAKEMMRLLCQRYPEAECELDFQNDFQLLTAVILSAQTTDAQVNKVTKVLFQRFPDPQSLADADLSEIKEIIRPTGYYNAKAANIQNCAKAIVERYGGKIPQSLAELTSLPGVGRKTANVVLGVAHGIPGWTVDTHVQRLSGRLGLSEHADPYKIEQDLQSLYPGQDWSKLSITLIWHGRRTCFARNPDCQHCPINHLCPSSLV
jgi:endonuclease-3